MSRMIDRIKSITVFILIKILRFIKAMLRMIINPSLMRVQWNFLSIHRLQHLFQAWRDLFARYKEHFVYFWNKRRDIELPDFRPHESDFLPAALSLQGAPVSPSARLIARILICIFVFILLWSIFGRMDIIVSASGKIIPSVRTKTIAAIETARVDQLHVREGQAVRAGDLLVELDTRMIDRERDRALGDRDAARLQVARSRALIASLEANIFQPLTDVDGIAEERVSDAEQHLRSQWQDYESKRRRLNGEVARYGAQLPLIKQQAKDYKDLAKNRDVSVHAWHEKEQLRAEIEGKLIDATNQRYELIAQTRKSALDQLSEGLKFAASSDQVAKRAVAHGDILRLTAPIDGTVQQLTVHTVGGVVQAAQPLMVIVPKQDQIELEAFIENRDIGFVWIGQDVKVKIEAFDYTKYGLIDGKVMHLSQDAIDPSGTAAIDALQNKDKQKKDQERPKGAVYSVKVLLNQSQMNIDGRKVMLTPGMSASVEIKTGSRRIIQYFLSPFIQYSRESLNER